DVGDVALEPDQSAGAGQGSLIQDGFAAAGLDEPRGAGGLLAGDDRLGAVLLGSEGLVVPRGALGRAGPHRPPRALVLLAVSDVLGAQRRVVLTAPGVLRGDGVDDLPVTEGVPVPAKVGSQVDGRLGHPGADDEPQAGLVQLV